VAGDILLSQRFVAAESENTWSHPYQ